MNYLSHYVFNHRIRGLEPEPYFALGVVLPDLWLRYSRKRRIRWKAVRAATPTDAIDLSLRAGLLNHIEADRRFHTAPIFFRWQRELKTDVDATDIHPALVDFLVHMSIELALDHRLLRDDPNLVNWFYDVLAGCNPAVAAARVGVLGAVDTSGLGDVIAGFFKRRFIRCYREQSGLADAVRIVLSLANIPAPPDAFVADLLARAVELVEPAAVWPELTDARDMD
ncbi:MAG: hypothetical protein KAY37_11805 [Phycisphaerae bacterium]|nr:hypothetical protein [Phycisphaerae bacterium]